MRNILAFVAALVITFLGVGYFLNWYRISTTPGTEGRRSVTIDLNTKKIGEDIQTGSEKIQNLIENANKDRTETKTQTPSPTAPENKTSGLPTGQPNNQAGWWTPAPVLPPGDPGSRWDTRTPTATTPGPGPWRTPTAYQEVPLGIPPARDR